MVEFHFSILERVNCSQKQIPSQIEQALGPIPWNTISFKMPTRNYNSTLRDNVPRSKHSYQTLIILLHKFIQI